MQSFLQHRRLRLAAQAQIDRDVERGHRYRPAEPQHDQNDRNSADLEGEKLEGSPRRSREDPVSPDTPESSEESAASDEEEEEEDGPALCQILTGIEIRDRVHEGGSPATVYVVDWEGPNDPQDPHNWPTTRRVFVVLQISLIAFILTSASGIDVTVVPQAAKDFGVSETAETMATGMFLIGMGLGSLIAGPFSETFGRNVVYTGSLAIYLIWIMASALAPNFGAQITFRFIAGLSSSTPLVCSGGSIADMFNRIEKTWAFPLYAICAFGGAMMGAVMGAYIGPSPVMSWRWVEWIELIAGGLVFLLTLVFMPETYGPLLLEWKAAHFRAITGDDRFRCEHEIEDATLMSRLKVSMTRPFILITEPIIAAMTLYITVVYIILFTFLVGWPFIFEYTYGIGQGLANITFIAMFLGTLTTFAVIPLVYKKTNRFLENAGPNAPFKPEIRLWYVMYGPAIAMPISLFWLGWTNYSSISIWSGILAVFLFGYSIMGAFICVYMYIIDSYEIYSPSALTFVSLVRYVASGGMTIAGIPIYEGLGTHWMMTIMGCISIGLVPIPYLLYRYGHLLRERSKYAVSM